jgi:ribosome recycling factor
MADPDEILLTAEDKMNSAIEAFRRELNGIRTGRAHPSLIETLMVDYYGAIQASDLGLNPAIDGQTLRLPIPPLTEQRRKDLVKQLHHKTEDARVAVRNVRRHAHDELRKAEKDGGFSQDDLKRSEDELQKITDAHIAAIDAEGKKKEADLLEV